MGGVFRKSILNSARKGWRSIEPGRDKISSLRHQHEPDTPKINEDGMISMVFLTINGLILPHSKHDVGFNSRSSQFI